VRVKEEDGDGEDGDGEDGDGFEVKVFRNSNHIPQD
jgi:hypothetical protein